MAESTKSEGLLYPHTHTHTKYGTITEDTKLGLLDAVCYT